MEDSTPDAERRTATDQCSDTTRATDDDRAGEAAQSSADHASDGERTTLDQLTEIEPVAVNLAALDLSEREIAATLRAHARTTSLTTAEAAQAIERGRLDSATLAAARTEVRELASLLDDLSD